MEVIEKDEVCMFGPFDNRYNDPFSTLKRISNFVEEITGYNHEQKSAPNYGDVIYVQRIGYKHFGIYIGDNKVIHYAHDSENKLCIHETNMDSFMDGDTELYACNFPESYGRPSPIQINCLLATPQFNLLGLWLKNNKKSDYHLYSPADTVRRARQRLGEMEYNLIINNCEHFALWCKTGIKESHQVNDIIDAVTGNSFIYHIG